MAMAFAMRSRRSSNRSYSTETQRHAARQLAVNLQKTLLVNKADRAALKQVDMEAGRAVRCLSLRFGGSNGSKQPAAVSQELESVTANTRTGSRPTSPMARRWTAL